MRRPVFDAWSLSWAALLWSGRETVDSWTTAIVRAMAGGWRTAVKA